MSLNSFVLVLNRNYYLVFAIDLCLCRASRHLQERYVSFVADDPIRVVFSLKFAMELEFKAANSLIALWVVANNPHASCLAYVIFVPVKYNLWDALSRSHSEESTNLVLKGKFEVPRWRNKSWSEYLNQSLPTERRYAFLAIGPVFFIQGGKLGLDEVVYLKVVFQVAC